jgi:hypothetical protein
MFIREYLYLYHEEWMDDDLSAVDLLQQRTCTICMEGAGRAHPM